MNFIHLLTSNVFKWCTYYRVRYSNSNLESFQIERFVLQAKQDARRASRIDSLEVAGVSLVNSLASIAIFVESDDLIVARYDHPTVD